MFRHQNWGSVLWISVTWIQRTAVLRFLVRLKGRMTSDTCKCKFKSLFCDFRSQRTIKKRLFCSACVQSQTRSGRNERFVSASRTRVIVTLVSFMTSEPWIRSRLGSGLGLCRTVIRDKDLSFFHCQTWSWTESREAQRCVYMLPLCITNVKLFSGSPLYMI